jgi:L-amino acid N-acyltransferase YncA
MTSDTHELLVRHALPPATTTHSQTTLLTADGSSQDLVAHAVDRLTAHRAQPHKSAITIINGDQSHANTIARIYNDSLPPGQQPGQSGSASSGRTFDRSYLQVLTGDVLNGWISQHAVSNRPLWIAMRGGKAVGWLSFLGMSDRPGLAYTAELALYVSQEAQRTGVGSHLVAAAISEAPSLGLDRLMVMIWGTNEPSLNLFQRFGFKYWGCLPGAVWAHNISHDMVILGRLIEKNH